MIALEWLVFHMLSPNMTIEIIRCGKCAITIFANVVFRRVWIVSVQVLTQLEFVEKGSPTLLTLERLVLFMSQQMRHNLFTIRIKFCANAATVRDVLLVILSMPNHVVERKGDIWTDDAMVLRQRM